MQCFALLPQQVDRLEKQQRASSAVLSRHDGRLVALEGAAGRQGAALQGLANSMRGLSVRQVGLEEWLDQTRKGPRQVTEAWK